jgi:hypothetical protein
MHQFSDYDESGRQCQRKPLFDDVFQAVNEFRIRQQGAVGCDNGDDTAE